MVSALFLARLVHAQNQPRSCLTSLPVEGYAPRHTCLLLYCDPSLKWPLPACENLLQGYYTSIFEFQPRKVPVENIQVFNELEVEASAVTCCIRLAVLEVVSR